MAEPAAKEAQVPADRPAIDPLRFSLAESAFRTWRVLVPMGLTPEDLLPIGMWAHQAAMMAIDDHIYARAEDRKWYARFVVLDVGANWAKVHLESKHTVEATHPGRGRVLMPGYKVEWGGDFVKYRIIREADRKAIYENIPTETEAYMRLADFARQVGTEEARKGGKA